VISQGAKDRTVPRPLIEHSDQKHHKSLSFDVQFDFWMCAANCGRPELALLIADTMQRDAADSPEGYAAASVSRLLRGEKDQALELARRAIKVSSESSYSHWAVGRVYESVQDWSAAVKSYDQVLALAGYSDALVSFDSLPRRALILAACPDRHVRNGTSAMQVLPRYILRLKDGPYRRRMRLIMACAYAEMEDFDKAVEAAQTAAKGETPEEAVQRNKLIELFESKRPYRMPTGDGEELLLEVPAVACYHGPYIFKLEKEETCVKGSE
jgi:tetratricopeptide (TPR) repeat protein